MKSKTILFSIFLMMSIAISSCSKDDSSDGDNGENVCGTFTTDYQNVVDANTAFSQNPTSENCEALKTAWLNFFDDYHDCSYWQEGDYQEAIDQIEGMDCSDF
ncbi:MAG TPA: hypothetical protein VFM82_04915 [Flavobacteriaceae bacterium]|nr:hypothetical protein [Flavobacteriaceae bacterium]